MDYIFCVGDKEFYQHVVASIQRGYQVGSEYIDDVLLVGQGVRWMTAKQKSFIKVDQERGLE